MRRSRAVAGGVGVVIVASIAAVTIAVASERPHIATAPAPGMLANGVELTNGSSVTSPVSFTAVAAVEVIWTVDGTFVADDKTAPFDLVQDLTAGRHRVSATAIDSAGAQRKLSADFTVSSSVPASPTATGATPSQPAVGQPTLGVTPTAAPPVGGNVQVSTSAQLVAALAAATPGTTIHLADGVYSAARQLTISRPCTAARPCTLVGGRGAILDGGGARGHYGLYLQNAPYWTVEGVRVTNGSKGIVADNSSHITITGVEVDYIGDEGVHLRDFTSDSIVEKSSVHDTGLTAPQYGEGIYVGSSVSNWVTYSGGRPDASDRNQIVGNTITRTAAENIDIKEGTVGGLISGNALDASAISGLNSADSWVDIKGNGWVVEKNMGVNPTNNPAFRDGFQTHVLVTGDGIGNTFRANVSNLGKAAGFAFRIQTPRRTNNVVGCDNTVTGGTGLADENCTAP